MRISFLVLCLGVLGLARPALAMTIVINQGQGHDCYLATLAPSSPEAETQGLAACNRAVAAYAENSFNLAASLVNRSEILIRMARFGEAMSDCDRAIKIASDLGAAHTNRGAALVGLKQYDDAIQALDRAVALSDRQPEIAYYNRGLAKDFKGDVEGAYRDYRKSLELNPGFAPAREQLPRFKVTFR